MTPHADRITAWLLPAELESLREWARGAAVDGRTWPQHPECRLFVDLALRRAMAAARRAGRARSDTGALRLVAADLGLDPDAVRRRWGRRRAEYLATRCPPSAAAAAAD